MSDTDFDMGTVDQETIAMANKFYALTEPEYTRPSRPPTDFNVRIVDEETIAMASKFYALTEPHLIEIQFGSLNLL